MKSTLQDGLVEARGRPSGFDYLRIGMAVAIVITHSAITSYGRLTDIALWESPLRGVARLVLPMFFSMSGFLVGSSLERCKTLVMFIGLRVIRIYPALAVEVLLSALLIGPLVTTLDLGSYFSNATFYRYLVNMTGHISYDLPGVFADNPLPNTVNAQLWTVPYELYCYVACVLAGLAGVNKRRMIAPIVVVGVCVVHLAARLYIHHGSYEYITGAIPGPLLIAYAFGGLAVYKYRDVLPRGKWYLALSLAFAIVTAGLPYGEYIALFPACYAMAIFGISNPRRIYIIRSADYSYGIFLYGFVIQQTLMMALPWARIWYVNAALSVPLAALVAAASWHLVERPALQSKHLLVALEAKWLLLRGRLPIPGWRENAFVRPSLVDTPDGR